MQDEMYGRGILHRLEDPPAQWPVTYRFSISLNVARTPGIRSSGTQSASGRVSALNGVAIPEGYFQLTSELGEILRVKNLGIGHWTMLLPL